MLATKKKIDWVLTDTQNHGFTEDETDFSDIDLQVKKVHKAIADLPEGYKLVCSLYLLEGYDHKEIAQVLNISESTSKSQYMRAKNKIKEILLNDE